MSSSINFTFTAAGKASIFNVKKTGVSLDLTHVQLGTGNRSITGDEKALAMPKQTSPIAAGQVISPTQIRMSAVFTGSTSYNISEVGLWSGDPDLSDSILVAYWSKSEGYLAVKSPGVDFIFSHDMLLNVGLPAGALNIFADAGQSAVLSAISFHESLEDPHPQYATDKDLVSGLAQKAPLKSPAFEGVPTAPTAAPGTNSLQIANMEAVQAAIAKLVSTSPAALDTLSELSNALGGDANFATTVTTLLSQKAPLSHVGTTGTAHGNATSAAAGFMSAGDKSKLDGVAAGAQVNTVTSVAGKTGAVVVNAADVGLGNVNNTADSAKSVSYANNAGSVPWGGVAGRPTALSQFSNDSGFITGSGNAASANKFSTDRSNYKGVTDPAVAGQLMWKHYGNNHTVFDASNGTSPNGTAINNSNAAFGWTGSFPTLMGWNGDSTCGVRVDSARVADTAGRAYPRRWDGGELNFMWSGQGGQPPWLWGGGDGANMYVYNPSNFSVNYANSAGSAPASDVHAWAKQPSKPSYSGSELGFVTSFGVNGYVKLPGGLIIQWCIFAGTTVTWPIAFPNAVLSIAGSSTHPSWGGAANAAWDITLIGCTYSTFANVGGRVIVIGY